MAQLVARLNGIQKARGSNPLSSTSEDLKPLIFMGTVLGLFFLPLRLSPAPQISIGQRSSRFLHCLRRNSINIHPHMKCTPKVRQNFRRCISRCGFFMLFQSCKVFLSNNGQAKNSSKLMSILLHPQK